MTGTGDAPQNLDEHDPLVSSPAEMNENSSLVHAPVSPQDEVDAVVMRWWVAGVFSVLAALQCAVWNFYSPIQKSVKKVYGWDDDLIDFSTNASSVAFAVTVTLWSMAIDKFGPRWASIMAALCLVVSSLLRCVPVTDEWHGTMMLYSMIFNGLAGPAVSICAPVISSLWFPASSRTTATAVMAAANAFGLSVGFVLGPLFVDDKADLVAQRFAIESLYCAEALVCCGWLAVIVMQFPDRPEVPPSLAATPSEQPEAESILTGFWSLGTSLRCWVLFLCMGIPTGTYQGWAMVLDFNLSDLGVGEDVAGWIGFWQVFLGCVASVMIASLCDRFSGNIKTFILVLYAAAIPCFLYLSLAATKVVTATIGGVWVSCVLGGAALSATIPLFYELAIESVYPMAGPGTTAGYMELLQMCIQCVFCFLPIDQLGTVWMDWTLLLCTASCMGALALFQETYNRLKRDGLHQHALFSSSSSLESASWQWDKCLK